MKRSLLLALLAALPLALVPAASAKPRPHDAGEPQSPYARCDDRDPAVTMGTSARLVINVPVFGDCPAGQPPDEWGGHDPHEEPRNTVADRAMKARVPGAWRSRDRPVRRAGVPLPRLDRGAVS